MKRLKTFESFSEEQIRRVLSAKDVELNIPVDEVINRLNYKQENTFGFDGFVDQEGKFISEGDKQRMSEYIEKFKELGLDTKNVESLYPKLQRYQKIQLTEIDDVKNTPVYSTDDYKKRDNDLKKLNFELDELSPFVDEFKSEIRKLAQEAHKLN